MKSYITLATSPVVEVESGRYYRAVDCRTHRLLKGLIVMPIRPLRNGFWECRNQHGGLVHIKPAQFREMA